jgi:hypothetical protein
VGGLQLASKAGSGMLSATSNVTKAGKKKMKSATNFVEGGNTMLNQSRIVFAWLYY